VTPDEKAHLQVIIMTLADPKGNWNYAWMCLCKMADFEPQKHQPPFKRHPLAEDQEKEEPL
jgi:hypothetical protein